MVGMPYAILGAFGFFVYRGIKKATLASTTLPKPPVTEAVADSRAEGKSDG